MKSFFLLFSIFVFTACGKYTYHVYSPDKNECITFIEEGNFQYIFDGYATSIPEANYVKLDVREVPELGKEIACCWKNDLYEWSIIIDDAIIIENKLDSTRFKFGNRMPINKNSNPTYEGFAGNGCFHFDTYYFSIIPEGAAIIE